jgi:hypothetical protein
VFAVLFLASWWRCRRGDGGLSFGRWRGMKLKPFGHLMHTQKNVFLMFCWWERLRRDSTGGVEMYQHKLNLEQSLNSFLSKWIRRPPPAAHRRRALFAFKAPQGSGAVFVVLISMIGRFSQSFTSEVEKPGLVGSARSLISFDVLAEICEPNARKYLNCCCYDGTCRWLLRLCCVLRHTRRSWFV